MFKQVTEEEKARRKEEVERKMQRGNEIAEKTKMAGNAMIGCGCLLTILVTIPIIIIVIFFL